MYRTVLPATALALLLGVSANTTEARDWPDSGYDRAYKGAVEFFIEKHPEQAIRMALDAMERQRSEDRWLLRSLHKRHLHDEMRTPRRSKQKTEPHNADKDGFADLAARLDALSERLDSYERSDAEHHESIDMEGGGIPLGELFGGADDEDGWFHVDESLITFDGHPAIGSEEPSAVLSYFYDYSCLPCGEASIGVEEALEKEGVQVIYRDLSGGDDVRSRLAMAGWTLVPEAFQDLHRMLFNVSDDASPADIRFFLLEVLDEDQASAVWEHAMEMAPDDEVGTLLEGNISLGEALGFQDIPRVYIDGSDNVVIGVNAISNLTERLERADDPETAGNSLPLNEHIH